MTRRPALSSQYDLSSSKVGQLLGWSSPDSVVGFSREKGHPNVQRTVFSAFPPL
ncbi:hypothetical protein PO124_16455 [Bacillus licheniformis]|nr:hypothetical protein [Bacillus licheniformis]